jgi:hypothetical protein
MGNSDTIAPFASVLSVHDVTAITTNGFAPAGTRCVWVRRLHYGGIPRFWAKRSGGGQTTASHVVISIVQQKKHYTHVHLTSLVRLIGDVNSAGRMNICGRALGMSHTSLLRSTGDATWCSIPVSWIIQQHTPSDLLLLLWTQVNQDRTSCS